MGYTPRGENGKRTHRVHALLRRVNRRSDIWRSEIICASIMMLLSNTRQSNARQRRLPAKPSGLWPVENRIYSTARAVGAGRVGRRRNPKNQAWTAESTYLHIGAHNVYYVKLKCWIRTGISPAHHLSPHLQRYHSDIPFSRQAYCHSPLLNAINHQSAYLDEIASANPLYLSGAKSMSAQCNERRGPVRHAENFYTSATRHLR